jgi:hypothetical protein
LLAIAGDPLDALGVALLYVCVQMGEGLVLDHIIDRMTVYSGAWSPAYRHVTEHTARALLAGNCVREDGALRCSRSYVQTDADRRAQRAVAHIKHSRRVL